MAEQAAATVYETEQIAKMIQGKRFKRDKKETVIVPVEGGFVLQEPGAQSAVEGSEAPKGSRADRLAQKRVRRAGLADRGPLELALGFTLPENIVPYWEIDGPGFGGRELEKRLRKGWEFVDRKIPTETTDDINRASQMGSVVTQPAGNGNTLYLMVIEKELADEDDLAYNAKLDEVEEQMRIQTKNPDIENTGLQMESRRGQVTIPS